MPFSNRYQFNTGYVEMVAFLSFRYTAVTTGLHNALADQNAIVNPVVRPVSLQK